MGEAEEALEGSMMFDKAADDLPILRSTRVAALHLNCTAHRSATRRLRSWRSERRSWARAGAGAAPEKHFLVAHQEADPRFITSIERVGPRTVTTAPFTEGLSFPWQIPKESLDKHEE